MDIDTTMDIWDMYKTSESMWNDFISTEASGDIQLNTVKCTKNKMEWQGPDLKAVAAKA